MTPDTFEEDLQRALDVTRRCVGQPILGFRAPSFTVTEKTLWAVDILVRNGIRYDSSIFPVGVHPDYGIARAPLDIHHLHPNLIEVPLTCVDVLGLRVPWGGGGYFRLLPYTVTRTLLRRCNGEGRPIIFYLHPWEIDPDQPRVNLSWDKKFRHYHNLGKTLDRLDRLLRDFRFTSLRKLLGLEAPA